MGHRERPRVAPGGFLDHLMETLLLKAGRESNSPLGRERTLGREGRPALAGVSAIRKGMQVLGLEEDADLTPEHPGQRNQGGNAHMILLESMQSYGR